jgi:hypothetical protein
VVMPPGDIVAYGNIGGVLSVAADEYQSPSWLLVFVVEVLGSGRELGIFAVQPKVRSERHQNLEN